MNATLINKMIALDGKEKTILKSSHSIQNSVERMDRMIGDLLDAAKIESKSLIVDPEPHSLSLPLDQVFRLQEVAAASKAILIERACPVTECALVCDKERIVQVLCRLVEKAIRFSPENGRVVISTEDLNDEVVVSVKDQGPGISEQLIPQLFDRYRKEPRVDRKGFELSNFVAAGIVAAHGGRIWVENTPNQDTTFLFSLPKRTFPLVQIG